MRKLYFLMLSLIVAIAAHAAPASQLYLIGEPAGGWSPLKGTPMEQTSDGVFEVDVTLPATQWFGFSAKLGTSASDWSTMNGARYGAPSNNYTPVVNTPVNLRYPSENSFQLGKGDWHFKVDTNDNTFTLSGQAVEDPTANILYLRGEVSGWNATETYKFTQEGDTYTLHVASLSGPFKIANSDYSKQFSTATPIELNAEVAVSNMGETNCTLAAGMATDVTLTFVKTSETTGTLVIAGSGEVTYPEKMYLLGNVNGAGFAPDNAVEMTAVEDGVYEVKEVAVNGADGGAYGYFSFTESTASTWDGLGIRYGAIENDFTPSFTEPNEIVLGDKAFRVDGGEKYDMTLSLVDMTLVITKVGGGDVPTPSSYVPETLFVMGNVGANAWDVTEGVEMNKTENVFSLKQVEVSDAGEGSGYIQFNELRGTTGSDWDTVNSGYRYGAAESNEPIEFAEGESSAEVTLAVYVSEVNASACQSFMIAAGTYDMAINFNGEVPVLTVVKSTNAINAVEATDANAAVEYYNLQGVRVSVPESGLYIRRQGSTVAKVYVK